MRMRDGNGQRLLCVGIVGSLLAGLGACGGDDGASDQPAVVTETVADGDGATASDQATHDDGDEVDAAGSGMRSEPFAELDMAAPPVGSGSIEFADHTVEFSPGCMTPPQMDHMEQQGFLNVLAGGEGVMPDGTRLDVRVNRSLKNADEPWSEGEYEMDIVTFSLISDAGVPFASTRAAAARSEVGGTVRQVDGTSDGLPMVKIRPDGQAMTAVGSAGPLHSTSPGDDAAILGPFRLAMTCE